MQYDKSFKEESLKLSDEIGVKAGAAQLGIPYYTLPGGRNNQKNTELWKQKNTCLAQYHKLKRR